MKVFWRDGCLCLKPDELRENDVLAHIYAMWGTRFPLEVLQRVQEITSTDSGVQSTDH